MFDDYLPDAQVANDDWPEPQPLGMDALIHSCHRMLGQARRRFGAARLEIGALLELIRSKALWQEHAATFSGFLEENGVNDRAAYLYMRVARRFFYELQLSESEIEQLAMVSMGILDVAARVATPENKADILALVTTLGERDAREALREYERRDCQPPAAEQAPKPRASAPVAKLYRDFRALPDDQRIELLNLLRLPDAGKAKP